MTDTITTANLNYNYYDEYYNKTLHEWVDLVHEKNSIINKWKVITLKKGCFGFDNLAVSLCHVFNYIDRYVTYTIDDIACAIHDGWCENYLFWRDNKPFEESYCSQHSQTWIKPFTPLGDERRNICASTKYEDLPQDEKDKDIIIAQIIIDEIKKINNE